MMQEVGVRAADFRRYCLEGYRLRAVLKQQLSSCRKRSGPTFFGGKACSSY